jgi:hypothetical protein
MNVRGKDFIVFVKQIDMKWLTPSLLAKLIGFVLPFSGRRGAK